MSRKNLSNFVSATEHSSSLRRELKECSDITALINLANKYGFQITIKDLEEDKKLSKIGNWFSTSKISTYKSI